MIINHNLAANNAIRNMNINTTNASKSMQKLSSGLRINSAADDAAGLAISEKMRGQIRGLDQASSNAQDGISMVQTAEGALNETTSILQRMRELAVQAATDTNTASDRSNIQQEVDQLASEITRISNTTEFNTQKLLNGGVSASGIGESTFQIGANADQNLSINIKAMDAKTLGVSRDTQSAVVSTNGSAVTDATLTTGSSIPTGTVTISAADVAAVAASSGAINVDGTRSLTITGTTANGDSANAIQINLSVNTSDALSVTATDNVINIKLANATDTLNTGDAIQTAIRALNSVDGVDVTNWTAVGTGDFTHASLVPGTTNMTGGVDAGVNVTATNGGATETVKVATDATSVAFTDDFAGLTLTKSAGATTAASFGATTLTVKNDTSAAAAFAAGAKTADAVTYGGINVSTHTNANSAINTIQTAIDTVSSERSKLGAYQNRLEHTIANLGTSSENLTSAESRIRDVDMAKEMSTFSKNNILSQAAQAMLAQANSMPQQVLQLLK